ncbi:Vegetative incompatibility protein HET-E-1 [Ceratobasidium sp. AG-Ba]|nr:Vegetative incompatibility protein HET-E-1 [Ceratobasidium sp. AG-Ba]
MTDKRKHFKRARQFLREVFSSEDEKNVDNSSKYKGWTGLSLLAKVLSKTPDFGPLKQSADILTVGRNRSEFKQLKTELNGLFEDLRKYIDIPVPPSMNASIQNLARDIKQETDTIQKIQEQNRVNRYSGAEQNAQEVLECYRRIEGLFRRLNLNANLDTWKTLDELTAETYINRLPHPEAAYYQSAHSAKLNRGGCTENTRVGVLQDLVEWTHGASPERIYWLNGMAGTGKTTISYSLCKILEEEKALAASFFCSRQLEECRDVTRIVPAIAYQLARYSIPFRYTISPLLKADPDVYNKPIATQFKELIVKPINLVKASLPNNLIIVIDALDECDAETGTADILNILLKEAPGLPLRFFVSSRPEHNILTRMRRTQGEHADTEMRLHELASDVVQADIRTYLKTELQSHMNVSEIEMDTLVHRSGVLFIYAATVVRYISALDYALAAARLSDVLAVSGENQNESTKGIDALYTAILDSAHSAQHLTESNRAEMLLILHTIVCAREPLSKSAITGLLKLHGEHMVEAIVSPLLSVLQISGESGVITTLHESFRDFLLERSRSGRFHCKPAEHNARLAELCFEQISKQVPFNICNLESSYVFDKDIPDLNQRIDRAIPDSLFYACRYWDEHIRLSDRHEISARLLSTFLSERLFLWMEVLNLKNAFPRGIRMLYDMKEWSEHVDTIGHNNVELFHDGWKFMATYSSSPVLLSTPHIYISALSFWPDKSAVGRQYGSKRPDIIGIATTAISQRRVTIALTIPVGGPVWCLAYSPDTKNIAVALGSNSITVWDVNTGLQVVQLLEGHTDLVGSVAYSPDGAHIVSGSHDNTVRIWDARAGNQVCQPLEGHTRCVRSVTYSPDGAHIASGSHDNTVRIWDTRTGNQVCQPLEGHTDSVISVAYSPDGAHIVSGSHDRTVRIWDARTGNQVCQPLEGHTRLVMSVAYSPDGAHIVSGSDDETVRIWDTRTGNQVGQSLKGHTSLVASVAYSPDGAHIVSGSYDNTVRIWDARTGNQVCQPLKGHTDSVMSVAYSPDGVHIVSGSWDNTVRIWDARAGNQVCQPLEGHTRWVRSVTYSPDGAHIASGSYDNTVRVWDARTGNQVGQPLKGHTDSVISVAYSPDGAHIVSGSGDKTVRIWDTRTGNQVCQPLEGHTDSVISVAYSPDGVHIVSGSGDKTVRIWDACTGNQVCQPLEGHTDSVISVAYSPDGAHIVSGSGDKTVRIWDTRTGNQVGQPLKGHTDSVISVAYSPDGAHIVSGSDDKTVRIWDTRTGNQVCQPLEGHTDSVISVAYSPDGVHIVSGSGDKTVRIWDACTGNQVCQPLEGHTDLVGSVAYSPDGVHIVSGSCDNTVRIWDARTGNQVGESLGGHTPWVHVGSVAYSSDGAHIVSGSDDNTVRIWNTGSYNTTGGWLSGRLS